uniref:Putative transcription factor tmf tata element modulatory factor n=1 Tax=Tabanus bromius TaxID=304241 RepID=A0A0K8TKP1_TABBR
MSWFDTSGLASLAKNALKEAQKQIDKALDIKDDDLSSSPPDLKSKTEPTTPLQPMRQSVSNPALWGSFTGSFFENPKAGEMVTTPPKSGLTHSESTAETKRQSVHSNSDSVEILSPPLTPCSGMTSPSVTVHNSESVEVITTPTSSELLSPESAKTPDSVEVITSDEIFEEDDDSMSFSTVMDDSVAPISVVTVAPTKVSTSIETDSLSSLCTKSQQSDSGESTKTVGETSAFIVSKPVPQFSTDDSLVDSQTYLSDSTQSFEDVQIFSNSDDKDVVKVVSAPNSGHTSADEVETATSSDIEIISNPNGDSSSTNSACRASPLKLQTVLESKDASSAIKGGKKGHCREPSSVSTQSDDSQISNNSEVDKLLRRVSELSEILEAREFRLLEIGRQNAELMEKNAEFKALIDAKQKKSEHHESEEYTQRLSALEKKFQMSIRERDSLRDQLKTLKNEMSNQVAKEEVDKIAAEKDFMIEELRTEGEKLSKQVLQHSTIIKKLRAKERDSDTNLKRNREQIDELTEEVERLKKSLAAKDEVERSQIEAVHKLSSEKRKLEKENQSLKSQLEDLSQKVETLQTSFDAARKELYDKKQAQTELNKKTEALANLETERQITQSQNAEILTQLEDLREKLRLAEVGNNVREQKLRQENADLLRQLESAEMRAEQLTQEVSLATIPLVRQLEALQATLTQRTSSWDKQEKELLSKLDEARNKLKLLEDIERHSNEQKHILNTKIKTLEERLAAALLKSEQISSSLQQSEFDTGVKESEHKKELEKLKVQLEEKMKLADEYREKCASLQRSLEVDHQIYERSITEMTASQTKSNEDSSTLENAEVRQEIRKSSSPTLSLGRNSIADSLGSSAWQMDDLDCISISGRQQSFGFAPVGHTATMLESLQSSLKQRDGEIHQLQWEMSRLQAERHVLNTEIGNLSLELENVKEKLSMHDALEKEFSELQNQYDALLQMYGEKVEENQELELDLQDVKEMYKAQIDELLRQQQLHQQKVT